MVYEMRQGNQGCYLDHGPYQSIECAPQWLEYLLTTSTCVLQCDSVATVQANLDGDKGRVATEENSFNTSINRCVPGNLRRSKGDTGVGDPIR